ncbi:MAG: tRNA (adenosine(37)-N6)-threonylcarbamoyltransferase complex ATPase subunit type 1 TsaE [Endomicrobium sp.]|uniref:tRNA (adenosine(37)-N6)-threonylcarbamoyltransferase complex ATPase subunit type 1 TsaE n=1 Tax=Candidatus Endomicrobiellum pyrsonymphae TaxID=1408203 RepID=UPI00358B89F5|nr:tRNA (adenosine(37)-N6)-threonylcarbamoyltransferase complex ATPase subunit type 1 TsaE [Endomicrobium sp.]
MAKSKKLNTQGFNTFKNNAFITKTSEETRALGKQFASVLKSGDIIFLKGDLGSGKTTFAQGVVRAFGNKGFAKSSSFMLVNEYDAADLKLFHLDLYRLQPSTVWSIGIEEYIYSENISLIEWADKLIGAENDNQWSVEIENTGSERKIKIEKKK